MGLTGVILDVVLNLRPIQSAFIRETVVKCQNLAEVFEAFESGADVSYSVAWIDCLAKGANIGRSVLMLGEHAESGSRCPPAPPAVTLPVPLPGFLLNRHSVALFNRYYYGSFPDRAAGRLTPLDRFFYPLDQIGQWNLMYGRRGFTQYQLVLPKASSANGLKQILGRIADAGLGSFLGVIKLFGPENENLLSFPMEGYTLALDFKIQRRLFSFLDELDRVVVDHGGRLYLTKDVRMKAEVFRAGYPRWEKFCTLRKKDGTRRQIPIASIQADEDLTMRLLVLGANSDIAHALARLFARRERGRSGVGLQGHAAAGKKSPGRFRANRCACRSRFFRCL